MPKTANPRLGRYVGTAAAGETVRAFVPPPLPPVPQLDLLSLLGPLSEADRAVGRLDGITALVPDTSLFLYMYVRKEAVLSSQIEGTQSTLNDLLRFESDAAAGAPIDDIREVSNYIAAMEHGLARLPELPLSLRLIREMHEKLMASGRGMTKQPGAFRTSQNWIGGTRPGNAMFVPPPPQEVMPALHDLETFLHDEQDRLPPLIKAGLAHVQFETIHPFLDGNGRLGRLLITLYLCERGVLRAPLLYLSLYFKQHRETYYRLLQEVRERGAWEAWLEFFLEGIADTANQAFHTANRIVALFQGDRQRIGAEAAAPNSVLRVHELLQTSPYVTAPGARKKSGLALPTVNAALDQLVRLGMVVEVTGKKRGRVYAYRRYLDLLGDAAPSDDS
ncbi:MAG: Fic family protein [Burkholderiales bacterium]|nr:MAG: Fic family protein [Burkholderiales bacterium]